ncbi:MAG: hypothetical protein H6718_25015 [Polyangiaceae bacterium]|nr:hypothetical protein [Polyangiaceae bacterium]MCB9605253.1 hypothetical protein [Polyangiaceae bacterium]
MSKIPERRPKRDPEWNPNHDRYWDAVDLEDELRRTFQICHECRMCVNYCGSFPILFNAVDKDIDSNRAEGVEALGPEVFVDVSEHCWQCKLCYIKCPYTDADDAYELLDFPRLMAREKAQRARRDGIPLVDQILGEPKLVGAAGAGPQANMANLINANRLVRKVTEKVTGISSEFPLPPMASEPFGKWFDKHEPLKQAGENGSVVLFSTCYGDFNFPEVPRHAVLVLEHNGYSVEWTSEQACCGMPNLDGGDVAAAQAKIRKNVEILLPHVREGRKIVVPGPTCGYTMKHEWPVYLDTPEAKEVAGAVVDLMEFLEGLRKSHDLELEFSRSLGSVGYHAACHLRAQKIGTPGARLLGKVPDTSVKVVQECSAVDGTWGMKAAYYEEGRKYAQRMTRGMEEGEYDLFVGDCNLAGQRLLGETGKPMVHPITALAWAYGLDSPSADRSKQAG